MGSILLFLLISAQGNSSIMATTVGYQKKDKASGHHAKYITLFLCGDVMTGRGIDQVLPHPSAPQIYEAFVKDAKDYVRLAIEKNGPVPSPVPVEYIWGWALKELKQSKPDLRIINLETSITASDGYWKGKGINYRMNPANIGSLTAARIDFCSLANNHVLDWGYSGLQETFTTLQNAGIRYAGAGQNRKAAQRPAVFELHGKGRVVIISCGVSDSGIPPEWNAGPDKPGVNLLPDLSKETVRQIKDQVRKIKKPLDIVVLSIHWGGNWGYNISQEHIDFAHRLIDEAGVDIIHGHSSHHVLGMEIYNNKPIIYGSGDFLNDYEGISGHERYRGDLGLMYFVTMDPTDGHLVHWRLVPTKIFRFRIEKPSAEEVLWLKNVLHREGEKFGTQIETGQDESLIVSGLR